MNELEFVLLGIFVAIVSLIILLTMPRCMTFLTTRMKPVQSTSKIHHDIESLHNDDHPMKQQLSIPIHS